MSLSKELIGVGLDELVLKSMRGNPLVDQSQVDQALNAKPPEPEKETHDRVRCVRRDPARDGAGPKDNAILSKSECEGADYVRSVVDHLDEDTNGELAKAMAKCGMITDRTSFLTTKSLGKAADKIDECVKGLVPTSVEKCGTVVTKCFKDANGGAVVYQDMGDGSRRLAVPTTMIGD